METLANGGNRFSIYSVSNRHMVHLKMAQCYISIKRFSGTSLGGLEKRVFIKLGLREDSEYDVREITLIGEERKLWGINREIG